MLIKIVKIFAHGRACFGIVLISRAGAPMLIALVALSILLQRRLLRLSIAALTLRHD
jgi:hypothetical protein